MISASVMKELIKLRRTNKRTVIVSITSNFQILYFKKQIAYVYVKKKRTQMDPWGTPEIISSNSLCDKFLSLFSIKNIRSLKTSYLYYRLMIYTVKCLGKVSQNGSTMTTYIKRSASFFNH